VTTATVERPTTGVRQRRAAAAYAPAFPSTELVSAAAALFDGLPRWDGHEGPRARIAIAPGVVAISRRDLARRERTGERQRGRHVQEVDELARAYMRDGAFPDRPPGRQEITGWSRRSRGRMCRRFGELDYEPWFVAGDAPAMITLTYPGDWPAAAPTGPVSKRHLFAFRRSFERAWGAPLRAIWKLEFKRRGGPHYHILMVPPRGRARRGRFRGLRFRRWLSAVWASIVGVLDVGEYGRHLRAGTNVDYREGARMTDPRRVANYFMKHGSFRAKEYQHIVPDQWTGPGDGPGRFWGHWRLRTHIAQVELDGRYADAAARAVRRWARAQGVTQLVDAPRTAGGRAQSATWDVIGLAGAELVETQRPTRTRPVRRRVRRLRRGAGWVAVNDGASFAAQIWRAVAGAVPPASFEPRRSNPRTPPGPAPPAAAVCEVCGVGQDQPHRFPGLHAPA